MRTAVSGVSAAGLSTTQLPAASAGAAFQPTMIIGKFHGMIAPTTPIGLRTTRPIAFCEGSGTCLPDIAPPAMSPA